MTDMLIRNVEPATIQKILEALDGNPYEFQPSGDPEMWTERMATRVLWEATPRSAKLIRAVIDAGGDITVEEARRVTGEDDLHHMVQPLTMAWRRVINRGRLPAEASPSRPVQKHQKHRTARVTRYRMTPDAIEAFTKALAHQEHE